MTTAIETLLLPAGPISSNSNVVYQVSGGNSTAGVATTSVAGCEDLELKTLLNDVFPELDAQQQASQSVPNPLLLLRPKVTPVTSPRLPPLPFPSSAAAIIATVPGIAASIPAIAPNKVGQKRKLPADQHMDEQELAKRQRNREHAKKSRMRKKSLTKSLQDSLADFKSENAKLKDRICQLLGKDETERHLRERMAPTLIPAQRTVDATTLTFLKGLRTQLGSIKS